MNKINTIVIALFALIMVSSCEESASQDTGDTKNTVTNSESISTDATQEEEVIEAEQSIGDRILEIKAFYALIQGSTDQNKNCVSDKKISYDGIEDQYPFENTAKECQLENNFMYQQVHLNGYE